MAIYHLHISKYCRGKGHSAIVHSAYINGEKIKDEKTGITADYSKKKGVVYKEVLLPEHAPKEYFDNSILWNAVHKVESKINAQLAREVEVALPRELSREKQIEVIRDFIKKNFINEGMCADWALHDKGDGNPHAHIMLTTRKINPDGTWAIKEKKVYKLDKQGNRIPLLDQDGNQKVRIRKGKGEEKLWVTEKVQTNEWNDRDNVFKWRKDWALQCNLVLGAMNILVDERSYEKQESELLPTIHEGYVARDMERKGEVSELCEHNRSVKARNNLFRSLFCKAKDIMQELWVLQNDEKGILDYLCVHPGKAFSLISKKKELADNKETMLKIVALDGAAYAAASDRLRNDLDVAMVAYKKDKANVRYMPSSLKAQIDTLIKAEQLTTKDKNNVSYKDEDVR